MQEHVDPAEVVSRDIDLLAEEAVADFIPAKDFFSFQKKRAGSTGRIVDLVDLCLADYSVRSAHALKRVQRMGIAV
jgi:hypothetical protein